MVRCTHLSSFVICLAICLCELPIAVADTALVNPSFEDGQTGEHPPGWLVPKVAGYHVRISDRRPQTGSQCAQIASEPSGRGPFGNIVQRIDAEAFRGKKVRYRAAVRTSAPKSSGSAQLWMRIDRGKVNGVPTMGSFDNMHDRPIVGENWDYYEIVGEIAEDAETISVGMMFRGGGQAWIDDVSLEIVQKDVANTSQKTLLSQLGPGLFEIRGATEYEYRPSALSRFADKFGFGLQEKEPQQRRLAINLLIPLPLSYRKQVPITYELTVTPSDAASRVTIYQDTEHNQVVKLNIVLTGERPKAQFRFRSLVLVGPATFQDVPEQATFPDEWPKQCQPWLTSTWCAESEHEQIQALAKEIVTDTDDVMTVIGRVERRASKIFADAVGKGGNLTAVDALQKRGSCTSCANLVAAMLRACNIPARVVAGYPSWSGPLQTHYIVEAFVPDFGWYPMESTLGISPWPNTHQVNVAIVPPEYERQEVARYRPWVAGGVPYLSLTEIVDPPNNIAVHGTVGWDQNCDHHCQFLREFSAGEAQWTTALTLAQSRWQSWVTSEKGFDRPGKLVFGVGESAAEFTTLPDLLEWLENPLN